MACRTDTLPHFLTDVADAIRTKTGDSSPIQASNFDTAIENIPSGGGADLSEYFETTITEYSNSNMYPLQFLKKIPPITINSELSIDSGFREIKQKVGIKLIYTPGYLISLQQLFYQSDFTSIDVTEFDTSDIINMKQMFYGCKYLTTLDLSNWDMAKVNNVSQMFAMCTALTQIDMRNATFKSNMSSSNYTNMFGASSSNGVPDDCLIIVKDNTAKTWITSKFSRLTNVKTVTEYESQ